MAMVKQPRLLLLDEPTASLDNTSKLKVRLLIERLKDNGCTMLGIFHDLEFMEGLCDREFNMQEGFIGEPAGFAEGARERKPDKREAFIGT
jgi:alpha-D-ribose 1-methylphosphonate 5-triphosphate synthase subunit PhnL